MTISTQWQRYERPRGSENLFLLGIALALSLLFVACTDESTTLQTNEVYDQPNPLEIRRDLLIATVDVDGVEDLRFLVDTGAQYVLLEQSLAEELGYTTLPSEIAELSVGDFTAYDVPALPWNLTAFSDGVGLELDGVLGATLFQHLTVAVDTQRLELVFLGDDEDSAGLLENGHVDTAPLVADVTLRYGLPLAAVALEDLEPRQMILDTGASSTFVFENTFAELDETDRPFVTGFGGVGAAGEFDLAFSRLCGMGIGAAALDDVHVGVIPADALGDAASLIPEMRGLVGASFFREFLTVFDAPAREVRFYRYQNREHIDDEEFNRVGISGEREADGTIRIVTVFEGTDAEGQGLEVGDLLLAIDGALVRTLSNNELEAALSGPVGEPIELELDRGGATEHITVEVDDLLPSCE